MEVVRLYLQTEAKGKAPRPVATGARPALLLLVVNAISAAHGRTDSIAPQKRSFVVCYLVCKLSVARLSLLVQPPLASGETPGIARIRAAGARSQEQSRPTGTPLHIGRHPRWHQSHVRRSLAAQGLPLVMTEQGTALRLTKPGAEGIPAIQPPPSHFSFYFSHALPYSLLMPTRRPSGVLVQTLSGRSAEVREKGSAARCRTRLDAPFTSCSGRSPRA